MSNIKVMRDSNMELLRIVAMLLVLVVHADFASIGSPTIIGVMDAPYSSFVRLGVEHISIISVNVFVLLSGWYGIKMKSKGLIGLLFQSLFFGIFGVILYGILIKTFVSSNAFWGVNLDVVTPASAFFFDFDD